MTEELKTAIFEQLSVYKSEASSETIAEFSSMNTDELILCHFGLGLYIRNNYLLPNNRLYELFMAEGITHKDDMSGVIIRLWHEILSK